MKQVEETSKQEAQTASEPEYIYLTQAPPFTAQEGSQASHHYSTEERGTQRTSLNTLTTINHPKSKITP